MSTKPRILLVATALVMLSTCRRPSVPGTIQDLLSSRAIRSYQVVSLDGKPSLALEYSIAGSLLGEWSGISAEVKAAAQLLQTEAESRDLRAVRIAVRSSDDVAVFDWRRNEQGHWDDVWRDITEVRLLPGDGRIGVGRVEQLRDADGAWMSISYLTEVDLTRKDEVRDQARRVLSVFAEGAAASGVRKVLLSARSRLHGGVRVGVTFVWDDTDKQWVGRY